jgi:hypothetical protein
MKIYISGKISKLEKAEYTDNFNKATLDLLNNFETLSEALLNIINPLDLKPFLGNCKRTITICNSDGEFKIKHWSEFYKENWLNYMINDIRALRKCTHIAMQKNWTNSKGAVIEYYFAKFIFKLQVIWL